jgi:hypothetical protein
MYIYIYVYMWVYVYIDVCMYVGGILFEYL